MMEALARFGFAVEVLCGPVLELANEIDLPWSIASQSWIAGPKETRPLSPIHVSVNIRGVPVTILIGSTTPRTPNVNECGDFLRLFDAAYERLKPDVVVTYGGDSLTSEIKRRSKSRGAATVFTLHNLRYNNTALFDEFDAVLVASRFAADHYRDRLGLTCTVLPNIIDAERALATRRRPSYAVCVNPTVEKGVFIIARIADELGKRRPDIPFLIVEGMGTENDVAACGLDLRVHGNVFFHEHTSDPRQFWRVARVSLIPSLVAENQPLVAIEAMLNGIPVLGSGRGGIPETLGEAGLILPLPDRLTADSPGLPTSEEVAPWVDAIVRLWDFPDIYERHSRLSQRVARTWSPEIVEPLYVRFFESVGRNRTAMLRMHDGPPVPQLPDGR
jgi:glycosyltransferase involved in cell wall biosynthesis